MRQKAAVYKQYGDAAIMSIVLESLPKVTYFKFFLDNKLGKNILFNKKMLCLFGF